MGMLNWLYRRWREPPLANGHDVAIVASRRRQDGQQDRERDQARGWVELKVRLAKLAHPPPKET
jgi:hypothetical protein